MAAPAVAEVSAIYVGKVPITSNSLPVDTITAAFHNSSRKTLSEVKATANGFFFFEFKTLAAMEEVIEGGPWLFNGQAIVLQKWEPGMVLRKLQHTQVPVWIKLRHLPVELWTSEGLSVVASGVGKPLYPDAITRACTRLDFARVCVMLDISAKLLKHIVIMVPKERWEDCPTTKPKPPPVSVYVQKPTGQPQHRPTDVSKPQPPRSVTRVPRPERMHGDATSGGVAAASAHREDKAKAIVLYNAFDSLIELDSDDAAMQGPNSSPIAQPDD
ncbi:UNVERIFIED_CONTAM: hypothetical protein Sradi_7046500 [Sesamum radiatum]|uniref:DUF4283 domain-containing protein n=1 Tax=Sesamum radiatum TaxID=300843 RepID=A0AAW2J9F0_SESRA